MVSALLVTQQPDWLFRVFCVVSGENLVPEPQVQDEKGATGEGPARGTSRGGRGQRSVLAEAGRRARAGPRREAVHQPAARRRRQGRTDGAAVVLASADARPDAQDVVVVDAYTTTAVYYSVWSSRRPVLSSYVIIINNVYRII